MIATAADPANSPDYWRNRSAGWTEGTPTGRATDDTFDRALIEAAGIGPGFEVLDLAAGTGDPAVTIAPGLGSGGVTALDLTFDMLAVGRDRADNLALGNVRFVVGDMAALPFADASFDAVTCRNGLMFPADRLACVAEARRVLRPGGRAAWLVWATIEENPTFLTVLDGLRRHFNEEFKPRMARHALGRRGILGGLIEQAGFVAVQETRLSYMRIVRPGDDYFRRAAARAIPHRTGGMSADDWSRLIASIEEASAALRHGEAFHIPVVARLGIGAAP
jgi:SAM-dependent methyltransferase